MRGGGAAAALEGPLGGVGGGGSEVVGAGAGRAGAGLDDLDDLVA